MQKKVDCHIHTSFSPDGYESPENMIRAAIDLGLEHICITDHMDLMYQSNEFEGISDLKAYTDVLYPLKEKYKNKIYIAVGIECGFTDENAYANAKLLKTANLEYIINSVHSVNGSDCYYPSHYENKTRQESYTEYFNAVLRSLDVPYKFNALGHLSYIMRTATYQNSKIVYSDFKDLFDTILKKAIQKDTIIELNTNVYNAKCDCIPDFDVIARYKELGGKYITFSSDAHRIKRLCENYGTVAQKAVACGFDSFTVIQEGEMKQIKIM